MSDNAVVYYKNKKAGLLKKIGNIYEFEYDSDYLKDIDAKPVSLTMPLTQEKYSSEHLFPFFENLLPEGSLLDMTIAKLKIDRNDKFKILRFIGQDTIGAISVMPLKEGA
jgi:serine/threonine-protein kinase HipA